MELEGAYSKIKAEATQLAGKPGDIVRRVALLHNIYLDSHGNHCFPQIALHGALWAYSFFETTGRLGNILRHRYFYNQKERDFRMSLLNGFAEGFKSVNRSVFIDTFTNYYFTKVHGLQPAADKLVQVELLTGLNDLHKANRSAVEFSEADKKSLFLKSLQFEQEVTVGPAVRAEVEKFHCPILTFLCLKPVVHFRYFAAWKYFFFSDFSDIQERILHATRAYDLAQSSGWKNVVATMKNYSVMPETFFSDTEGFVSRLKS